jgi:hypothetical protein
MRVIDNGIHNYAATSGNDASCGGHCACRHERSRHLAVGGAFLALFPLAHATMPILLRDVIPTCPFRILTGKPCPLCGATRAIALASHARWHEAFAMNPLWPGFAGLLLLLGMLFLIDGVMGGNLAVRLLRSLRARWMWIACTLILFDGWRIVSGLGP